MVKFKNPPKEPGWYVAWWDGKSLNMPRSDVYDLRNVFYWDGDCWYSSIGCKSNFWGSEYFDTDRWSYLPKDHLMRGKPAPKKVDTIPYLP